MNRTEIINKFIKCRNYKNYLEIGIDNPDINFNLVECENKYGIEPFPKEEYSDSFSKCNIFQMTSDAYFKHFDTKYDIIFIDGLHTEEQCDKDIYNSLKHLNRDGVIIIHDCLPYDEIAQMDNICEYVWNGTVWRSVEKLTRASKNGTIPINIKILDEDFGIGIIEYTDIDYEIPMHDEELTYELFDYDRKNYLNIISEEDIDNILQDKSTIDIFYIATGVYTTYFENFFNTIHNFFPKYKKFIHIISDGLSEYNGYENDYMKIEVIYQMNLPYPIISLCKTEFIKNYANDNMKYVFYMDADTIFLERPENIWDNMKEDINNGNFQVSMHPGNYYPTYSIIDTSAAFIAPGVSYCSLIASFYGGRYKDMIQFCDEINAKIKQDLTYHTNGHQMHYIPPLFDQDYANAVMDSTSLINFTAKFFVKIEWFKNQHDIEEENILLQKYDISRKFEAKNMI